MSGGGQGGYGAPGLSNSGFGGSPGFFPSYGGNSQFNAYGIQNGQPKGDPYMSPGITNGGGYNFAQGAEQSQNAPQGDPYMGRPSSYPSFGNFAMAAAPQMGGSMMDQGYRPMDSFNGGPPSGLPGVTPTFPTGMQNPSSSSGPAPTSVNLFNQQGQGAPGAPAGAGPGSQAYQQALQGTNAQQAYLQSLAQQDHAQQLSQYGPPPDPSKVGTPGTPGGNALGNFAGSPNTWLYGPTPGALFPQLQRPQGTPNNFGYFPSNGTWGLPPGRM